MIEDSLTNKSLADALQAIKASYDEFPYTSYPFSQSNPGYLRTVAKIQGLDAPALEHARVLELGCAGGGNLIPIAVRYPQAQAVGVDLSKVHVESGNAMIRNLKLGNAKIIECSITDVDAAFGTFDYIIAHGVYSWVTDEVRQKIRSICKQNLSPNGVAYISYNTLPGWNTLATIRDMALFHADNFDQTKEKIQQAKSLLEFVSEVTRNSGQGYTRMLTEAVQLLKDKPDYYFAHDFLELNNKAFYFSRFVEDARKEGLQYLSDASIPNMYLANYPDELSTKLGEISDVIRMEQYLDFVTNKSFRSTLLCHDDVLINRNLEPDIARICYYKTQVDPEPETSEVDNLSDERPAKFYFDFNIEKSITTDSQVLKAVLYVLSETNEYISYQELMDRASVKIPKWERSAIENEANRNLLELFLRGRLSLRVDPVPVQNQITEKPKAWEYARHQGYDLSNPVVTNLYHEAVPLSLIEMYLIRHLDGNNTREQVLDLLEVDVVENKLEVKYSGKSIASGEKLRTVLTLTYMDGVERFAKSGLLIK